MVIDFTSVLNRFNEKPRAWSRWRGSLLRLRGNAASPAPRGTVPSVSGSSLWAAPSRPGQGVLAGVGGVSLLCRPSTQQPRPLPAAARAAVCSCSASFSGSQMGIFQVYLSHTRKGKIFEYRILILKTFLILFLCASAAQSELSTDSRLQLQRQLFRLSDGNIPGLSQPYQKG